MAAKPRAITDLARYGSERGNHHRIDDAASRWTQILEVAFEFHTSLVFYDAATGRGQVYRYRTNR